MSPQRSVFSVLIAAILMLCSATAAAQDLSPKIPRHSALKIIILELHTAPHGALPAHGLRESSPEEIQRIEQLNARHTVPRQHSSAFAWNWFPDLISAEAFYKPLLSVDHACLRANLMALAHTNLSSRYPIPPPATLV